MRCLPAVSLLLLSAGLPGAQPSGGTVEGQVVDAATGAPVRKALVGLVLSATNGKGSATEVEADSSGKFAFTAEYGDPDFLRTRRDKGVALTLAEDGSATIELTAIPAGK